jgi:hypothetical protein
VQLSPKAVLALIVGLGLPVVIWVGWMLGDAARPAPQDGAGVMGNAPAGSAPAVPPFFAPPAPGATVSDSASPSPSAPAATPPAEATPSGEPPPTQDPGPGPDPEPSPTAVPEVTPTAEPSPPPAPPTSDPTPNP